jgi:hypothetical protein
VALDGRRGAAWDGACALAPGLTSVGGPGWLRVGDMMVAGVIPRNALRALGLSGPSTPGRGGGGRPPGAGRGASLL